MDATYRLLEELTNASGASGFETDIRTIMHREFKALSSELGSDKLGSIYAVKKGGPGPRIMLDAHMDEIGFIVRGITKDGYIKFLQLGGWWGHVALGQRMRIVTRKGTFIGVVGSRPPHILEPDERKKVLDVKEMFLDVGVKDGFDVRTKLGVRIGDPIVPDAQFAVMGNPDLYVAKAFDNRMACAMVVDILRALKGKKHPNTVIACASVQEEVGLRGAHTLAHIVEPDVCFAIDTCVAMDVPPEGSHAVEKLGAGTGILVIDGGMIPNTKLRNLVIETAEKKKLPYHLTALAGGSTDAAKVQPNRGGVPAIALGPSVRYIHSSNSVMSRKDYDSTVKLMVEMIMQLNQKVVASLTH